MHVLAYVGAALSIVWGTSHAFATNGVVRGFGELTTDNRRIITMEWIAEAIALIFAGAFVVVATAIDSASAVTTGVDIVAIVTLVVLAVVSLFTGFKIRFLPFRLCPFIFSLAALLIGLGAWL